jgi:hypothetical protein
MYYWFNSMSIKDYYYYIIIIYILKIQKFKYPEIILVSLKLLFFSVK